MTSTPNFAFPLQATGANPNAWGVALNDDIFTPLDTILGSTFTQATTGGTTTIAASDALALTIKLTGVLVSNATIKLPATGWFHVIDNQTTGAFTVTVLTTAGGSTGPVCGQATQTFVKSDATNVVIGNSMRGVTQQSFASSGTYTPTPGTRFVIVEEVGGGGGGQIGNGVPPAQIFGGGGGGGGEFARGVFTAAQIGASQTVTIGAAGTAATVIGTPAGNGGTTSIGSLLTSIGGNGAPSYPPTDICVGGTGGTGGTGTGAHIPGGDGANGGYSPAGGLVGGGSGGGSFYGLGGHGAAGGNGVYYAARAGQAPGSGGGGGGIPLGTVGVAGADGAKGFVLITEFQ